MNSLGVHKACYEQFACRWRGRHKYRTRFERYNIEIGNLNVILSEFQFQVGNLVWCIGAESTSTVEPVADGGLDFYSQMAMDLM